MSLYFSSRQRIILISAVLFAILVITLFMGLPYGNIQRVFGQYESGSTSSAGTGIDLNSPTAGDAEAATVEVPRGSVALIVSTTQVYWGPGEGKEIPGASVEGGKVFFVSGLDDTGTWVRFNVGISSFWVPRSATNY